jgi:hypothetical protein
MDHRRSDPRLRLRAALLLASVLAVLMLPATAAAHGPVDPAASSYLARVSQVPAGLDAKVVDGDQRMWLRVESGQTVVVLDYRGAPYLRFSRAGVEVNQSSAMYYLNQVPAQTPPASLGPNTAPAWNRVSGGHVYEWHDGRLHALATTVLAPGTRYVGRWTVPVRVNGHATAIAGGVFYAPDPPIVWFWPIVVAVACVLAALRLRRAELDLRVARGLAVVALVAFALAGAGQQLHGRPFVTVGQVLVLALVFAFAAWGLRRIVLRRHGWFTFFIIAAAAIWEGASLITVLLDGFVLMALPAVIARVAVVTCLAAGVALLVPVFAIAERPERRRRPRAGARLTEAEAEAETETETETEAEAGAKAEAERQIDGAQAWEPSA